MQILFFSFLLIVFIVIFAIGRFADSQGGKIHYEPENSPQKMIQKESHGIKLLNGYKNTQAMLNTYEKTIMFYIQGYYIKLPVNDIADIRLVINEYRKMAVRFTVFNSIKNYDVILIEEPNKASDKELERVKEKCIYWKSMVEPLITDRQLDSADKDVEIEVL